MLYELWVFPIWLVKTGIILGPVWVLVLFPLIFMDSSFSGFGRFFHMQFPFTAPLFSTGLWGSLFIQLSFSSTLSWDIYPPSSLQILNSIVSMQEVCSVPLRFFSLYHNLKSLLRQ